MAAARWMYVEKPGKSDEAEWARVLSRAAEARDEKGGLERGREGEGAVDRSHYSHHSQSRTGSAAACALPKKLTCVSVPDPVRGQRLQGSRPLLTFSKKISQRSFP